MDIDAAETEAHKESDLECPTCKGQDLDTLKGGGRVPFHGYCGFCNAWGHKRADCRRRAAELAKGGKGHDEKGKDAKGHDAGKGKGKGWQPWQQNPKGGWQRLAAFKKNGK